MEGTGKQEVVMVILEEEGGVGGAVEEKEKCFSVRSLQTQWHKDELSTWRAATSCCAFLSARAPR